MIKLIKEKFYRVWYRPYSYPDEEDFMDVTANNEEDAKEFVRTAGYTTDVEEIDHKLDPYDESIIKESDKQDIMDLLTSERVDLMIDLWNDPNFVGSITTEKAMQYWEDMGYDTTGYTAEEFNRVWDLAQDELDAGSYVDEEDDFEEEIETKEDAYYWLQSKLADYGNTYHFPQEERIKLDRLIDRFGNTYFWRK